MVVQNHTHSSTNRAPGEEGACRSLAPVSSSETELCYQAFGRGNLLLLKPQRLPDDVLLLRRVSTFPVGRIRELFTGKFFKGSPARAYDVSADGQRLLMCRALDTAEERVGEVQLTLNWSTELERLVPSD